MIYLLSQDFLLEKISPLKARHLATDKLLSTTLSNLQTENEKVSLHDLQQIVRLHDPNTPSKQLFETIKSKIDFYDPVLSSLVLPYDSTYKGEFSELLQQMQRDCDVEVIYIIFYEDFFSYYLLDDS